MLSRLASVRAITLLPVGYGAIRRIHAGSSGLHVKVQHIWAEGSEGHQRLAALRSGSATRINELVTVICTEQQLGEDDRSGSWISLAIDARGRASMVRSFAEVMHVVLIKYAMEAWTETCCHVPAGTHIAHLGQLKTELDKLVSANKAPRAAVAEIKRDLDKKAAAIGLTPRVNSMLMRVRGSMSAAVHRQAEYTRVEELCYDIEMAADVTLLGNVRASALVADAKEWFSLAAAADAKLQAVVKEEAAKKKVAGVATAATSAAVAQATSANCPDIRCESPQERALSHRRALWALLQQGAPPQPRGLSQRNVHHLLVASPLLTVATSGRQLRLPMTWLAVAELPGTRVMCRRMGAVGVQCGLLVQAAVLPCHSGSHTVKVTVLPVARRGCGLAALALALVLFCVRWRM